MATTRKCGPAIDASAGADAGDLPGKMRELTRLAAARRISRREFVTAAIAAGLTAPAALGLMRATQAATPQPGGRMRQAITGGGTGDVLDPAQTLDTYMINVSFGQLRQCLTEIAPDGSLIGEVAESWESTPDATRWTFKLRPGIEFHNGKTLGAADVVASINHHRGENSQSAATGIVAAIEEIVADGDTVTFALSGGSADFPYLMSDYHLVICPANADGSMDWESGVGSGGYMLESFDPGIRTLVKRNPNFWKENRAFFDEIETLYIADVNARQTALQTGQIDVMGRPDFTTLPLMERMPGIRVIQTDGNQHVTFPMLTDVEPFGNNDLRLALKYAVDREQWLERVFQGYGQLGNDHPIGPANKYQATELEQRVYDPDKAKFHLKQAGMEGISVTLHVADTAFEGAVDAAQLYQETAKAAGIDLQVVREPNDGYWSNVWMQKPWCASYWGGRPTEDWIFSQIYSSGADWNEAHWENERFNELLKLGRAELDDGKRREIYVEMQQIVRDEGGSVIPIFAAYVQAASTKVGLPEVMANNWELDGHRNGERWWFVA
jgi:peptide/nickel transport system substrate-binding protein